MNTDMNQYLIFRSASTVVRIITAYQLYCAGLARSLFVLTEHISSWRASEASETLSTCNAIEISLYLIIYLFIYLFNGT